MKSVRKVSSGQLRLFDLEWNWLWGWNDVTRLSEAPDRPSHVMRVYCTAQQYWASSEELGHWRLSGRRRVQPTSVGHCFVNNFISFVSIGLTSFVIVRNTEHVRLVQNSSLVLTFKLAVHLFHYGIYNYSQKLIWRSRVQLEIHRPINKNLTRVTAPIKLSAMFLFTFWLKMDPFQHYKCQQFDPFWI